MARSAARAVPAVVHRPAPTATAAAPARVAPAAGPATAARAQGGPPAVKLTAIGTARPAALAEVPASGGEPLPEAVQGQLNVSLKADLRSIRLHTNAQAREFAASLSARAVTYGRDIFLGPGEQPTDAALIGHEVAHVIQQQGVPQVQRWSNAPDDAYEREARSASAAVVRGEPFAVRERTASPRVQRWGLSDVLDYFADKANNIPGFRMFTIVLGVNPINWSRVERSAANILRALIEFLPGGKLITDALNEYGIFDKIGTWVEQQLKTLGDIGAAIKQAISDFLDSLGWRDIFRLGSVWNRAKRIFTDPITRIINFGKGLVIGILKFIKEAILKPLAKLAEKTRGYDLLKAVIGEDPVTGEKVPRTPDTLIGGFMKLIGQEEVWNNIKKAKAIPRAWAWFQGVLSGLLGFVRQIPSLFIAALKSLELFDVVLPPRAFVKLARVFGNFIGKFLSWGLQQVFGLLQIIFEVVAPGAVPYIRKAAGAFKKIIENPIGFIRNLVKAGIQGFKQFGINFIGHLRKSLIDWLTGTMSGANIHIPQAFTPAEIIKFVLSVLGLTWQNIRAKLVKAIGEPAVKALETAFDIVVTLVKEGPAAAWDKIVQAVSNLKEMVIEEAMNFVKRRVVEAAIQKLVTSLNPAGAFIQAIIAIYNTIMFFVERLKQIARVAMAFIDSIAAIANGVIAAAANKVEQTMAGLLTLVISFLARIAGLGKVADAVKNIIDRVRAPIDKGLDRVVEWIVAQGKKLGRLVATAGVPQDPNERLRLGMQAGLQAATALSKVRLDGVLINRGVAAIKLRYGFKSLEGVKKGDKWWLKGTVNPTDEKEIKEATDEELQLIDDGVLTVDQRRALLSSARAIVANETIISMLLDGVRKGGQKAKAVLGLRWFVDKNLANGYRLDTKERFRSGVGTAFEMDYYGAFASGTSIRIDHVRRQGSPGRAEFPIGWSYIVAAPTDSTGTTFIPAISFDFMVHPVIEKCGVKGVGSKMFSLATQHFATQYQAVQADWYRLNFYKKGGRPDMSVNLVEYLAGRRPPRNLVPADAAKLTWTYKRVKELYKGVELELYVNEAIADINNVQTGEGVHVLMRPKK